MIWRFRITGTVTELENGRPIGGLLVRGYDRDVVFDDFLGGCSTDAEGNFEITYTDQAFRQVFDQLPDLYLRVFDAGGERELYSTRHAVRNNASEEEHFNLQIPADVLHAG